MQNPIKGYFTILFLFLVILVNGQDNNPYDTLITKGMDAIQMGDLEPAKDIFYAALELFPEGNEPYYMLGFCYAMDCVNTVENCDLGISFLDKAIDNDKHFRQPFYHRALCKSKIGDIKGALADIDAQIELNNTDPAYVLLRAELYYKLDNKEGACSDFSWWQSIKGDLSEGKELIAILEEYCRE